MEDLKAEARRLLPEVYNQVYPNGWQWDDLTSSEQEERSGEMLLVIEAVLGTA